MISAPRLLNSSETDILPDKLFSDLQLDKILSAQTIAVLQKKCDRDEIVRRNELFALLDKDENEARIENTLAVLNDGERALRLLGCANIPLDKYHRSYEAFESYIDSCERLASMSELGSLFWEVAAYFSSETKLSVLAQMKRSVKKIKTLLGKTHVGLLSFENKNWLTPDYEAVSEFDRISECAKNLGFETPGEKIQNVKIDLPLSDAMCRLYSDEVAQIESEIAEFSSVDLYEPTLYINEIKFFLEIHSLIKRAEKLGVPHCISGIAKEPEYTAKEIYDISLLAKNCDFIVPNDADFSSKEPFAFLLGANGGGKTTYLRAIGINLVLFLAGCPVFARSAEIYPFDAVMSHFPCDERFDNIGRLDEEFRRAKKMMDESQNKTAFLLFNETFSGTDDKKGFELLADIASKISEKHLFGLYVTHFHDVMSLDYPVLSAEVDLNDANKRTFRIVKAKGDASSYAADILKKYGLDKKSLEEKRSGYGG